ncbi:hypothetical protein FKM82_022023 [Ascaphus truei]
MSVLSLCLRCGISKPPRMEASCLELALEGERLCKSGDCRAGVSFFEAAVQVGTEDLKTLSAIYSQLGNAYFYLHEYSKALEYHHHDLTLARTIGDRLGEAKASGNLGNTLKVLSNFEEAALCCERHLEISRELYDKRLLIAKEFGDRSAERRAYSNLGNAFIFLGEFEMSAEYYKRTLQLAWQLKDRAVEAQSCYSLGNTYTLLQDYDKAIDYHLKHLVIARELNDRVGEGRACWSLGNAYTALGNHDQAVHFAEKHLDISREVTSAILLYSGNLLLPGPRSLTLEHQAGGLAQSPESRITGGNLQVVRGM